MLRLEELTEEEMDKLKKTFTRLAQSSEPLADEDDPEEAPAPEPAGRQRKQGQAPLKAAAEGN
jgi:hypothetical protein